jgi:signal transduction histidine kinase/CheY-like chemotaxis protein
MVALASAMNPIFLAISAAFIAGFAALLVAYHNARKRADKLAEELARAQKQTALDQNALQKRKQLDTLKDEFISTVSHELRTPLTSIRGALGLLSAGVMGKVDDKALNLLRIASTNTDRLVRLINDILDLERMDAGRAPLHLRRCALSELVLQAVETMRSMADAAGIRIEIVPELQADPIVFEGDSDRMLQVLVNLLSNAIKFSPRGSSVRILGGYDGENLLLRIEDRGRGVPTDKLETIFDRFHQVEASDARQKGGTGLGLAICRSILAQHGGSIWAERNDVRGDNQLGTSFVLRMPRMVAASEVTPLPLAPQGAILVVDDDASVRQIVAEQLRRHGYTVLETDRGEQAVSIAAHQDIEAILLDLYMPGLTGWQTIEKLKQNPATANIPVVVLSVLSPAVQTSDSQQLLSNAQGWVQKPFNESLLLAELGRVLHSGTGPGRILLVEDDEDLASVVLSSFEIEKKHGKKKGSIGIHHVSNAADARLSCESEPPDILILDLTLPDGSGFALVDWLRRQPALRTLPLVVYSGREVTAAEMEQLRLGPTQFLTKARVQPQDVEELVLAMVRHLRHPVLETWPSVETRPA